MTTAFGVRSSLRSPAALRIKAAGLAFQRRQDAAIAKSRIVSPAGDGHRRGGSKQPDEPPKPPKSCREIIAEVAAKHEVSVEEILSDGKAAMIIPPRHEAMYRCVAETALSLPAIGRIFHRDHTSIGNAVMRHHIRTGAALPRGMDWKAGRRKRR